jgi:hypothetical protein
MIQTQNIVHQAHNSKHHALNIKFKTLCTKYKTSCTNHKIMCSTHKTLNVTTLALGSRPRQRLQKVQAKCEGQESHFMLPRVWENVREWTFTLPSELSSLERGVPMESRIFKKRLQGSKPIRFKSFLYYWKALERRCLKWARMAHLDIWNTSYCQKKGRKSNCQIWLPTTKSQELPQFLFV